MLSTGCPQEQPSGDIATPSGWAAPQQTSPLQGSLTLGCKHPQGPPEGMTWEKAPSSFPSPKHVHTCPNAPEEKQVIRTQARAMGDAGSGNSTTWGPSLTGLLPLPPPHTEAGEDDQEQGD